VPALTGRSSLRLRDPAATLGAEIVLPQEGVPPAGNLPGDHPWVRRLADEPVLVEEIPTVGGGDVDGVPTPASIGKHRCHRLLPRGPGDVGCLIEHDEISAEAADMHAIPR
jgi:hypothetical protein